MMGSLLVRGMLAGILAGLLAFGFAKLFGEPQVDRAMAFEQQREELKGGAPAKAAEMPAGMDMKAMSMSKAEAGQPELVSRATQSGIGLLTGVVAYGAAFGGLFALVFGVAYGRLGRLDPRSTAALLAAAGFVAAYAVPSLKYPANPPAVGLPETIGYRTILFLAMIAISVSAMGCAVAIGRALLNRLGPWNSALAAGAVFIGAVAAAQLLLPALDEVPGNFPAVALWNFRLASIGIQAVMWATLGLVFGALAQAALLGTRSAGRPAFR